MKLEIYKHQTGIALITAMLVVSLATVTAVSMTSEQQIFFRRTENVLFHEQAYLYLLGAEDWARHVLVRDRKDNETDSTKDDWAQVLPALPVEGGTVGGVIEDLQGRFNINNLAGVDDKSVHFQRFKQLLDNYGIPESVANAVLDWMDKDQDARFPDGAEDVDYMQGERAYRSANRIMQSTSELLYVKGFTFELFEKIEPALTALPTTTDINVNTATVPVLQMMVAELSEADAQELIKQRDDSPFESIEDFLKQPAIKGKKVSSAGLSVDSQYFILKAFSRIGRANSQMHSILYRPDDTIVMTLARSQGGL